MRSFGLSMRPFPRPPRQRQQHPEGATASRLALYVAPAAMRLDDPTRLIEPDAQSLGLGALEWLEERLLDVLPRHDRAVVAHRQDSGAIDEPAADRDRTLAVERLVGVQDEVRHHRLELLAVAWHGGRVLESSLEPPLQSVLE